METEELDFSKDVAIDEDALDVEWQRQPELLGKWGRLFADAEARVNRLDHKLDVLKADLERRIRAKPKSYGITEERVTEGIVKATVLLDSEHETQQIKLLQAQHSMAIIKSAINALYHKKDALENLVRLLGAEYFSGPVAPRDLSAEKMKARAGAVANAKMRSAVKERKTK